MNQTHNHTHVSAAQKVLWKAELLGLMKANPVLMGYVPMLETALFYSNDLRSEVGLTEGQPQLIAYRDLILPKFVVVVCEVLRRHDEITSAAIEHAMAEITLYAQVSHFNDEPFVNFVVSPRDSEPVVFLTHTTGCGSSKLVGTTLGLNGLLDRFPGQVENILTQISFVTGAMEDSRILNKQKRGVA
jgi:hypothetical protein